MTAPVIGQPASLDVEQIEAVQRLVAEATSFDLVAPLNEAAMLALHHETVTHYLVNSGGSIVGYAQYEPHTRTAQLCIQPEMRGAGTGTALCAAVLADAPGAGLWAFGNLPAAQALAARIPYVANRGLLIMERPLTAAEPLAPLPAGVTIRGFEPGDEPSLLAINAAAFADHPEQAEMDHANFTERTQQPWYDPADLLVAVATDGEMLGFHWTKRHTSQLGEVYVIATAPAAYGQGIGSALLTAGLARLANTGCRRVILYVEADNKALRLYRRHGFVVARSDVVYAPPERQFR